ncbi:MAG: hypothetical protein WDN28_30385 [Chthoniobacter sp.]
MHHHLFRLLRGITNNKKHYAIAFPFIVGALRTPPGGLWTDREKCRCEFTAIIHHLLEKMPEDHVCRISCCDRLEQPVITLYGPTRHYNLAGAPLYSAAQQRPTLFITPDVVNDDLSIATLVECLWRESADAICTGRFSFDKTKREYRPFTLSELQDIELCLNQLVEEEV